MSDNYIHIIPAEAGAMPAEERRQEAVLYFRAIAPKANEVIVTISDHLWFVDCGGNFGKIYCPSCRAVIELRIWQHWMDDDFVNPGFTLTDHSMPCCGARHTLHELGYAWAQGFARCDIRAMNPNIGKLSDEHQNRFEEILGCRVRVIYEHM